MIRCQNCNSEIPDASIFCQVCGSKIETPPADQAGAQPDPFQTDSTPPQEPAQPAFSYMPPSPPPQAGGSYTPPYTEQAPNTGYSAGNNYQAPPQSASYSAAKPELISLGGYVGMLLLGMIPLAGLIVHLIWAFSSDTEPNRRNFSRAWLIIQLIGIALGIILTIILVFVIGIAAANWGSDFMYDYFMIFFR